MQPQMTWRVRAFLSLWVAGASACAGGPAPSHALVVRNLESKCALIAFSACAAFASDEETRTFVEDEDAGSSDEAPRE